MAQKFWILLFLVISAYGSACQSTAQTDKQRTAGSLSNTSWQLTGINNKQVMTASMGEGIYLTFEPFENRISGFAGCNQFFGNYRFDESGTLTFDAIGSTKMMCRNMPTETEFLNAIRLITRYEIKDATLKLYQGNTLAATFSKIPYRK